MDFVERVTSGFGNAEQFAYLQEDDLFLYSGFINRIKKNKTSSHFLREDIAWDDEQCGASMLNKLALGDKLSHFCDFLFKPLVPIPFY